MPGKPTLLILAATTNEAYQYCHRAGIPTRDRRIVMRRGQIVGFRTAVVHALPSFHTAAHRHSILAGLKHLKVEWIDVEMPEKPIEDQGDGMGPQLTLPEGLKDLNDPVKVVNLVEAPDDSDDPWYLSEVTPEERGAALADEAELARQHKVAIRYDRLRDAALLEAERLDTLDHLIESAETADNPEEPDGQPTGTPESSEDAAPAPTRKRRSRCKACGELKDLDGHDCPMDPTVAAEPAAGDAEPEDAPLTDSLFTDTPNGDPFGHQPGASDGFF